MMKDQAEWAGTALDEEEQIARLQNRVAELESELQRLKARDKAIAAVAVGSSSWLGSRILGSNLITEGKRFSDAVEAWQQGRREHVPLAEGTDLAVAAFARFVRVGIATIFLALIPYVLLVIQTWLLSNQNLKLDVQNDLIGQDVALAAFEQTNRLRDLLELPPQPLAEMQAAFAKQLAVRPYPHPYNEGAKAKWSEPRRSSVIQIAMLAESQPVLVFRSLIPLLSDPDGVVSAGALLSLRDILVGQPSRRKQLKDLLPAGHTQPIDLRNVHLADEDFSVFMGTELFYNARFTDAVLENVKLDGLLLKGSEFSYSTILHSSFKNAILETSKWNSSRVRATSFEGARLFRVYAEEADFGTASSAPLTVFPPVVFHKAMLNDAVLNRSSMVGARLHDASLSATQVSAVDFSNARLKGDELVTREALQARGALFTEEAKYGR